MKPRKLADLITGSIKRQVARAATVTGYREPLVGFVAADDPRFPELQQVVEPTHMMPHELLPGACSVVSFFLPFDQQVVEPNIRHREKVAHEWAEAYLETNALIGQITAHLIGVLAEHGIRATAEPATGNFDPRTLTSRWSHKSIAVLAGLGSLGLHHLLITDAGCAGRLGSLVLDAELPINPARPKGALPLFPRRQLPGVRDALPRGCSGREQRPGQAALLEPLSGDSPAVRTRGDGRGVWQVRDRSMYLRISG